MSLHQRSTATRSSLATACLTLSVAVLAACSSATTPLERSWSTLIESPDAALMSVHGSSPDDVWIVGADRGEGPLVLHWDGNGWERKATGHSGDLWWVQAHADGSVYMSGSGGLVLRYQDDVFERLSTPGLPESVVFGVWASSPSDLYAVGTTTDAQSGFLWHFDGQSFRELPLPEGLALDASSSPPGLFKVWGRASDDVWIVGARGTILRGDAVRGFAIVAAGEADDDTFFTVHGNERDVAIVGGLTNGILLEDHGAGLVTSTPPGAGMLQGVWLANDHTLYAAGIAARVFERGPDDTAWRDISSDYPVQSLHSVWADPDGGLWTVGGNVLTTRLDEGAALYAAPPGTVSSRVTPYELSP